MNLITGLIKISLLIAALSIGNGKSGFFSTISFHESLLAHNFFLDDDNELEPNEGLEISA